MVPVKKPIIAAKAPEASAPQKRRPRNQELNSSKRKTGQQALAELRKQKLNCSAGRIPDELKPYYQEITQNEFAEIVGADPAALSGIISDIENEYGEKIVGYVTCKPEYEEAFLEANIDSGFITESGKVLNGVDDGYISGSTVKYAAAHVDNPDLSSSTDQSMNCAEGAGESGLDSLVNAVKASNATDYDDKMEVLNQNGAYEEELMADAYYKAEQELSKMYGMPNIMLETSVQNGRGRVDALTDGGEPGCATLSTYDFQKETEAVWDTIKSWNGDTAGLVDAVAQKVVSLVKTNSEEGEGALNSTKDQSVNCSDDGRELTLDLIKQIASTLDPEMPQEAVDKMVTEEYEAEKYDHPDYPESDLLHQLLWDSYGIHEEDIINAPSLDRDYLLSISERADIDYNSSKNQSMNCSEDDSGTIYTESGNQVAITDIKVVQNPETNALALFVPENGDDEIPEGFTVIGDVIATASGAPAIEENAETGDDSLNSSKKPPMNRAQRRAAQRGARRPKKR